MFLSGESVFVFVKLSKFILIVYIYTFIIYILIIYVYIKFMLRRYGFARTFLL